MTLDPVTGPRAFLLSLLKCFGWGLALALSLLILPSPASAVAAAPDTIGLFRADSPSGSNTFFLRNKNTYGVPSNTIFGVGGAPGDQPLVGDWNGDGIVTFGLVRSNVPAGSNTVYLWNTNQLGPPDIIIESIGAVGDIFFVGDWDGNGTDTLALMRPNSPAGSNTIVYWNNLNNPPPAPDGSISAIGAVGDMPVAGKWTGSGGSSIALLRPGSPAGSNTFFIWNTLPSTPPAAPDVTIAGIGAAGDVPLAGNWDANVNTTDTIGLFRSNSPVGSTTFFLWNTNALTAPDITVSAYGASTDRPVTGAFGNSPPAIDPATFSVAENKPNGTNVGTVTFSDPDNPDQGQTLTLSIQAGNTGGTFAIDASTGQITVANNALLDFETHPTFNLTVRVTDNGNPVFFREAAVTINLTDVNDAPVVTAATFGIPENSPNGTVVGTVTATDQDAGQTKTFSITAGNTGGAFTIGASSGQITVATSAALDFETTPQFLLTVQVQDNGAPPLSGSNTITVNLSDVNEAPVVTAATFGIPENSPNGTVVGTVTATDQDAGQTKTFSITAGNTGGAFAIGASSGQITVATSAAVDFETNPTFSLTVQVLDNGAPPLSGSNTITVNLTNVNEAPVVSAATFGIPENSPNGTVVGTVTATDQDAGQTKTFSITAGNTGGAFTIGASSGQITVATTAAVNFETNPTFSLTVQVQDNGAPPLSGSNTITVNLTNVNDKPVAIDHNYGANSAQANMKISIPAGTGLLVGATDEDVPAQPLSVNNVSATTPANGNVTVNPDGSFDFNPPPGVTGNVTFTYQVCDDGSGFGGAGFAQCSAAKTVTFNVASPVIWFVDPNLGSNGDGRLSNPFNSLASANTVKGTNAGHKIFVYDSTDPDNGATTAAGVGVTLDVAGNQWLVGQGVTGITFDALFGISPPAGTIARPGLNRTRPVIQGTVAMNGINSAVRGLNITPSTANANGLTGGAVTGVTVGEVDLSTTGTGTALSLSSTGGTVSVGNVTSSGGTAVSVNAGSGTVDVTGTISRTGAAATGISVTNRTTGTVTFSGGTKTINSGGSTAVNLATNTGATITFSGGGLNIDTTAGTGFNATGGGTVDVSGSNNTITTNTGTGVNMNGVGGTLSFRSVDVSNGGSNSATNGISINSLTTGSFTVTGDGTMTSGLLNRNGSGGTLNKTTSHSVLLSNASNVTLRQMNITNTAAGGACPAACTSNGVNSSGGGNIVLSAILLQNLGGDGWNATNLTGVNSFDNNGRVENWQTSNAIGIQVINTSTNFTSLTLDHSLFTTSATGAAGFLFSADGTTTGGTVNVTNSEFTAIDQNAMQINNNGSGTIAAIVQKNNFHDADATGGDGNNTLYLTMDGSGQLNFTVGGPTAADGNTFHNLARLVTLAGVVQVDSATVSKSGSKLNGSIQHNTISNDVGFVNGRRAIDIQVESNASTHGGHVILIANNTVSNIDKQGVSATFVTVAGGDTQNNNLTIQNNTFTNVGTEGNVDSGSAIEVESNADAANTGSNVSVNLLVQGNTAQNNNSSAVGTTMEINNRPFGGNNTSVFNVTMLGNTFTNNNAGGEVFEILNSSGDGTALPSTCLDLNSGNTSPNNAVGGGGTGFKLTNNAGTFTIEGLGASTPSAFLGPKNQSNGASPATITAAGTFTNSAGCTVPSLPTF